MSFQLDEKNIFLIDFFLNLFDLKDKAFKSNLLDLFKDFANTL